MMKPWKVNIKYLTVFITFILFSPTIAYAACTYTISPLSYGLSASTEASSITVTASSGDCTWTVTASDPWIVITSALSGTGNGTVSYFVGINTTGAARKGTITIGGQTVTVRQAKNTFIDDPKDPSSPYIYTIYAEGISKGCNGSSDYFCPADVVTRGQMAVFIIRALFGDDFDDYNRTPYFTDVPATYGAFKYIQKMRDTGITQVNGSYGVDDVVTRGQMAVFIIRSKYGDLFNDYSTAPYFTDVPATYGAFKYIQMMRDVGITQVTGTYNVDMPVTRYQMAVFLTRAYLDEESAQFAQTIVNLSNQMIQGQISDTEFITQFRNLMVNIDGIPYGRQLFQAYLDNVVLGANFTNYMMSSFVSMPRTGSRQTVGLNANTADSRGQTLQNILNDITNSQTYQAIKAFIQTVISQLTTTGIPEPAATALSAADPEVARGILTADYRKQLDDICLMRVGTDYCDIATAQWNAGQYAAALTTAYTGAGIPLPSYMSPSAQSGVCGSSNGGSFSIAPTTDLCSQGTASPVSGSGPWYWTCAGSNGGSNASCSALLSSPSGDLCCAETNGCPSETLDECPGDCCCCPYGARCGQSSGQWMCGGTISHGLLQELLQTGPKKKSR